MPPLPCYSHAHSQPCRHPGGRGRERGREAGPASSAAAQPRSRPPRAGGGPPARTSPRLPGCLTPRPDIPAYLPACPPRAHCSYADGDDKELSEKATIKLTAEEAAEREASIAAGKPVVDYLNSRWALCFVGLKRCWGSTCSRCWVLALGAGAVLTSAAGADVFLGAGVQASAGRLWERAVWGGGRACRLRAACAHAMLPLTRPLLLAPT